MRVFRFMSIEEFAKYNDGKRLLNNKKHEGKTNSVGFCFLNYDEYTPEQALHFLSGITSLDICAVFETNIKLNQTYGIYAKPIKSTGNWVEDLINLFNEYGEHFTANEYCTTEYNNKNFKLLKFTENVLDQWNPQEEQIEFNWEEIRK